MNRGPKPKPNILKMLDGTRSDRINYDEPVIESGVPKPPFGMSKPARTQWDYYAPLLSDGRVLTLADREALGCYCDSTATFNLACRKLKKEGLVIIAPSGFPVQNPWMAIKNKAKDQMLRWGSELGLSPSSRARIKIEPKAAAKKIPSRNRQQKQG